MPAWQGGPCPDCGDEMPPNLMTCQSCRAPLNSELVIPAPELPEFIPFQEITEPEESSSDSEVRLSGEIEMDGSQEFAQSKPAALQPVASKVKGVYINCPSCTETLKVDRKYLGQHVECRFCKKPFELSQKGNPAVEIVAVYCPCPHCQQTLKAATGYVGQSVMCKHCQGPMTIVR